LNPILEKDDDDHVTCKHVIKPVLDTCYELALGNMSRIKMFAALQVHRPEHRTGNEKDVYPDTPICLYGLPASARICSGTKFLFFRDAECDVNTTT
jgi:hypothetical protein